MKAKITSFRTSDTSSSSPTFLQDVRQFLFPQRSQITMFVNLGLQLTLDSLFIVMKSENGL